MSKEYKNIDDLFRSELGGEAVKVPKSVKAGIDSRIGAGNNRKWLLFMIPALLIAGAALTYTLYPENDDNLAQNNVETQETESNGTESTVESDNSTITSTSTNEENEATSQSSLTENKSTVQTGNTSNYNSTSNTNNESSSSYQNNNETTSQYADSEIETNTQTGNDRSTQEEIEEVPTSNDEAQETNRNQENDDLAINSNNSSEENPLETQTDGSENEEIPNENPNQEETGNPIENRLENNTQENSNEENLISEEAIDTTQVDEQEEVTENPEDQTEETESDTTSTIEEDGIKPDRTQKQKPKWSVGLNSGLSFNKSTYSGDPEFEPIYQNNVSDKLGFQTDLDFTCTLPNNITFGSGIGLQSFIESYSFYSESYSLDSTVTLTWTYEYDSLDTLQLFPIDSTSSSSTTYDTTTVVHYDESGNIKARYLHIPLRIGMTFGLSKKLSLNIYGLARFNYLYNIGGMYMNSSGNLMSYSKANLGNYKKFYFDFGLGAKLNYEIVEHFYVSGKFNFTYTPNMMNGLGLSRKMRGVYTGLGITYQF